MKNEKKKKKKKKFVVKKASCVFDRKEKLTPSSKYKCKCYECMTACRVYYQEIRACKKTRYVLSIHVVYTCTNLFYSNLQTCIYADAKLLFLYVLIVV